MPLYEPNVPTRYTAPLRDFLRDDPQHWLGDALAEAGIDESLFHEADAMLTFAQFDGLLTALRRLTQRSDLGFELGRRFTRETHGALGQAMARCETAEALLRLAARYSRLMSPSFSLQYSRHPSGGELIWRPAAGMSTETLRTFYEIHVVSLYTVLANAIGETMPHYDSWLPMPRPQHAARYQELRKLRVHFGESAMPEVRTVLDATLLAMPLNQPEPDMATVGSGELSRMQSGVDEARQWSDWVRLMLREADAHQPTQAQLAELLNMSPHTLARRLTEEHCRYRDLAVEIRHQRACTMLDDERYSIAQIAHRLGYGSAANFSHAFRLVQGQSPRMYRQRLAPSGNRERGQKPLRT